MAPGSGAAGRCSTTPGRAPPSPPPQMRGAPAPPPELGAVGTLLNPSEKRLPFASLESARALCAAAGLLTVVCAGGVAQGRKVASLRPGFVGLEPPALIDGRG